MGVPLDFFSYRDEDEKQELSTDITNIIDLSTAPVGKNYLRRIIRAFFEANHHPDITSGIKSPYTLFHTPRFIQNVDFMKEVLLHCHPDRVYDFPPHIKIQPDSISAVLIRMSELTDSAILKTVLGNPNAKLNVANMIDQNKIFLVDLKETSEDAIVGSIIAAKIQQAIFGRRHLPDLHGCKPYCLYIDECDVILKFCGRPLS